MKSRVLIRPPNDEDCEAFINEGLSRRFLKVCGRWRDHERWAILAEDFPRLVSTL
ncbi:MAG TPA: hypothetical protein VMF08_20590 [Candidatus Sulfotelmatobacter sp.]|nr:hypothetical protein [Candidatus Sulfotelmatobacter sp.]